MLIKKHKRNKALLFTLMVWNPKKSFSLLPAFFYINIPWHLLLFNFCLKKKITALNANKPRLLGLLGIIYAVANRSEE